MCVPVIGPEVSMVCDAGSVSRPTRLSKDGSSRDGKIPPPKDGVREIASRPTTAAGSSSRGGSRVVGLLALAIALAINLGNVECKMLVELPLAFRCIWNDLPHIIQFVAMFMMLVLLYGVNRAFDKADEAMSTRLSCATAAFLHERRHHHAPRPRVLLATGDKVASAAARDAAFLHERAPRSAFRHERRHPRPPPPSSLDRHENQSCAVYGSSSTHGATEERPHVCSALDQPTSTTSLLLQRMKVSVEEFGLPQ